ncbi:sulfatase [Altericroceibacterium endophyticum]|nr:sulfatase [Altericroceibacterium endophyticum]
MKKRDFLKSGVAAVALGGPLSQLNAQNYPKPSKIERRNLLLITADDIDWSCIGFMTGREGITPNLDRLAARSHRFRQMRTSSPICMPSRQAFMSGLRPHRNGGNGFFPMHEGTSTITSRLSDAGWFTGATHKIKHMRPASSFPWNFKVEGKDRHPDLHARGLDLIIEEARAQYKPWFANCNINDPHRPFYNSEAAIQMDHGQQGAYKVENEFTADDVTVPSNLEDLPEIREEIARYWNSCQRFDKAVGNILRVLEESGEADNTVIVFISDHGMPLPFGKATCYDHGVRVPALISYPGMAAPTDFDQLAINLDLHPTTLELMGVEATPDIDGRSLVPLMEGRTAQHRDMVMTHVDYVSSGYAYPMRGLQDERYTLLFTPWANSALQLRIESMWGLTWPAMLEAAKTDPRMRARADQYLNGVPLALYDLKKDPGQRVNLIDEPRYAKRAAAMKDRMLREMEQDGDPQYENFRLFLSGQQPIVVQEPASHRMAGFPDKD